MYKSFFIRECQQTIFFQMKEIKILMCMAAVLNIFHPAFFMSSCRLKFRRDCLFTYFLFKECRPRCLHSPPYNFFRGISSNLSSPLLSKSDVTQAIHLPFSPLLLLPVSHFIGVFIYLKKNLKDDFGLLFGYGYKLIVTIDATSTAAAAVAAVDYTY